MPAPSEHLERGAICLALYPFTIGFPLETIERSAGNDLMGQLERHDDIESIEATIAPGDVPEVAVKLELRRVLLLRTATDTRRQDVLVARITSITDSMRARGGSRQASPPTRAPVSSPARPWVGQMRRIESVSPHPAGCGRGARAR